MTTHKLDVVVVSGRWLREKEGGGGEGGGGCFFFMELKDYIDADSGTHSKEMQENKHRCAVFPRS